MQGFQLAQLDPVFVQRLEDPDGIPGTLRMTEAGIVFVGRGGLSTHVLAKRVERKPKAAVKVEGHIVAPIAPGVALQTPPVRYPIYLGPVGATTAINTAAVPDAPIEEGLRQILDRNTDALAVPLGPLSHLSDTLGAAGRTLTLDPADAAREA